MSRITRRIFNTETSAYTNFIIPQSLWTTVNNNLIGEIVPEVAGLRNHVVVLDLSANCLYGVSS